MADKSKCIEIRYTCEACGLDDVRLEIEARGEHDIVVWMKDIVTPALGRDHFARSPLCRVASLTHVKIPLPADENGRLGDPTTH